MSGQQENFAFHPRNIMLVLMLFGLSAMFLALTLSYTYTRYTMGNAPVRVPIIFAINTAILLASSWMMVQSKRSYQADNTSAYLFNLKWAMLLSVLFMICQSIGWWYLLQINKPMQASTSDGYLWVISILHLVHVLAGLPFLYFFYKRAKRDLVDPVTVLVYFSDSGKQLSLRLLTLYWHFVDLLWLYLVAFFLVNMMV
jgi:cytochrome c oxidase subunit III